MKSHKFKVVSFSGIDGAGKSTQIAALMQYLESCGCPFKIYTFWDDAVAFSNRRERLSLQVFKGQKGVGSPDRPIARRDKNVTSWYVILVRLVLYVLDALRLPALISRPVNQDVEFVVFDRYIYDELANLPVQHWTMRLYTWLLLRIAPRPEMSFLLDADPETAISRKPEYPLEFVRRNRNAYLTIARMAGMTILPPSSISQMTETIRNSLATLNRDADSAVLGRFPATGAKCPAAKVLSCLQHLRR